MEGSAPEQGEGWYYQQVALGFNYRMTDLQAALGASQMDKLDGFLQKRREIAARYSRAFAEVPGIGIPEWPKEMESGWHLYVIRIQEKERAEVYRRLQEAGIGANVHYIPVYRHPYYRRHGYEDVCCPRAEELYRQIISLPIYPGLTGEEQQQVIDTVRYVCG